MDIHIMIFYVKVDLAEVVWHVVAYMSNSIVLKTQTILLSL